MTSSTDETNGSSQGNSERRHKQKYIQPYGVEGIEDLEDYTENGLHPVNILDILDGRFEVCHKLGSGGIATVWLCYEASEKRWRAIKVNAASHSSMDSPELRISRALKNQAVGYEDLERHHIVMAEETSTFWIEGPNGKHLCSVLPVLGPSLSQWREMAVGFGAVRIQKVCYELTEGLHFLHEHGICHGDFRPQNILMRLADGGLDHLDPDELFELISLHNRHEVCTIDGSHSPNAPKWVIEPLNWYELKDLVLDNVAIVDLGEAFELDSPPRSLGIPRPYASPEVMYGGAPLGKESDVWSLAITLMEVRTGEQIDGFESPLDRMENIAGPIPPPYRSIAAEELYRNLLRDFDASSQEDMPKPHPPSEKLLQSTGALTELFWKEYQAEGELDYSPEIPTGIEDYLGEEFWETVPITNGDNVGENEPTTMLRPYRIPKNELTMLTDLLRGMLMYKPHDRTSTSSVLGHRWFTMGLGDEKLNIEELKEQPFDIKREAQSRTTTEEIVSQVNSQKPSKKSSKSEIGSQEIAPEADTSKLKTITPGIVPSQRPRGQKRFTLSASQMLFWLSTYLPILLSIIILWKFRHGPESMTIEKLEVVNIFITPNRPPVADANQI
ncbi:kinase-like domain-containing protein [Xylaria grammica]|nr:kinase-like domain-containing protein [Xylaria grammica]